MLVVRAGVMMLRPEAQAYWKVTGEGRPWLSVAIHRLRVYLLGYRWWLVPREDVALAVAQHIETALGGWQRPLLQEGV